MAEIKFETFPNEPSAFNLYLEEVKIGEMIIEVKDDNLTVYHTEVDPDQSGNGYAGQLLAEMVAYARAQKLKIIPLCPYVHAQFNRHPDLYADLWKKED